MATGENEELGEMVQKMWGLLDHMAESNPEQYQKFVKRAMEEGRDLADPPQPVFCFSTGIRGVRKPRN